MRLSTTGRSPSDNRLVAYRIRAEAALIYLNKFRLPRGSAPLAVASPACRASGSDRAGTRSICHQPASGAGLIARQPQLRKEAEISNLVRRRPLLASNRKVHPHKPHRSDFRKAA
jgi:hypothetical protein